MKRRAELKRTPFKPRTKPIKPVSDKRKALAPERRELVQRLLRERPFCEVKWDDQCWGKSVDVHEIKRRSQGGQIVGGKDYEYMTACRHCHHLLTINPTKAFALGFAIHGWEDFN